MHPNMYNNHYYYLIFHQFFTILVPVYSIDLIVYSFVHRKNVFTFSFVKNSEVMILISNNRSNTFINYFSIKIVTKLAQNTYIN